MRHPVAPTSHDPERDAGGSAGGRATARALRTLPTRFGEMLAPLLVLLALLTLLTALLVATVPRRALAAVERTYPLEADGRFVLHADTGDVTIIGTDRSDVHLVMEGKNEKVESSFQISEQTSKGALEVRIERERGHSRKWLSTNWGGEIEVRVEVPRATAVRVRTSGGSIDARDLGADAELHTSGGAVTAQGIAGALDAATSGGSIEVEACKGRVHAETSGGNIDIARVDGDVEAETSGGSIEIEGAGAVVAETSGGDVRVNDARGRVDAQTSGGSARVSFAEGAAPSGTISSSGGGVNVAMDPDADVDLDASASGGSVRCDLPVTVSGNISKHSLHGKLGDGGALLKLRSSGGGIDVVAR